jgi:hypothetical protein
LTPSENKLPATWFPDHTDGKIDSVAQALLYPYPAPEGDYLMRDGLPREVPEGISLDALEGRVPLLSVGSNRAPLQLRRKFGEGVSLPVTACILHDADIVFAASLSSYSAIPATACPCPGVAVRLNVAWLDPNQLATMHDTESVGHAYDYVRLNDGLVDHGTRPKAAVFEQPVFGYQSRAGVLERDGAPVAHSGISAEGRQFAEADEAEMLEWVQQLIGAELIPVEDWVMEMRESRSVRAPVKAALAKHGIAITDPPWQVVDARAQNAIDFL